MLAVPSATSRIRAVAVNVFETEPMPKSVSWSIGNGLSTLVTPCVTMFFSPLSEHTNSDPRNRELLRGLLRELG